MEKSQWYIGSKNGVVLCVDQKKGSRLCARIYHGYSRVETNVSNVEQLLFEMENFFDTINYPHPTTDSRKFIISQQEVSSREEKEKIMSDKELLSKRGDLGTFIIRVQHRQNSSWQGRITWMDEDKTVYFRSVWEMIKLVENALDTVCDQEDIQEDPSWFEGEE